MNRSEDNQALRLEWSGWLLWKFFILWSSIDHILGDFFRDFSDCSHPLTKYEEYLEIQNSLFIITRVWFEQLSESREISDIFNSPKLFYRSWRKVHFDISLLRIAKGAVAPKTASALWQGFMLCMESLPYFYEKSVEPMAWIADDLRFATQLSNVYGNAIRAKLATAQTTRSVADSFSSFVTQNLQSICSLYHRLPRFFS